MNKYTSSFIFNKNVYYYCDLKKIFELDIEIPSKVVGIGGSIRALSKIIMTKNDYPLDILHGYTYSIKDELSLLNKITNAQHMDELKELGVKKR